jgi:non-heme chloroperoxidase
VAKDAGVSHAVLIGHSMGLPVIHTVVRRNVLTVDKAVFLDGAIIETPAESKARAEQDKFFAGMNQGLKGPDYTLVLEKFFEGFMLKVPPKDARAIIAKVRESDQTMVASTFEHFRDADVWAPLRSDIPVLGLYAKTSEAGVKPWLDAHYPRNKLVVWSDVDHFLQLEQPQRVNKAIAEFLK